MHSTRKGVVFLVCLVLTFLYPEAVGFPFVERQEFVRVFNQSLYLGGSQIFIGCANYWQALYLGAFDREQLHKDVAHMKRVGLNCVRIMATSEGQGSFRTFPNVLRSPYEYDQNLLVGLDYALDVFKTENIKVIACLSNYWHWSGGFAQYVEWVTGDPIPYPASWDPKLDKYTNGSFDAFVNYTSRFYGDPQVYPRTQRLYQDVVKTIITRRNTINSIPYKY